MRTREGQFSDNRPVQRNRAEKERLLAELKQTLAAMKPHAAATLRQSISQRIAALEAELAPRR